MKKKLTIKLLAAGILFTLAAVLYSCGGGGYGGGSGGNTMMPTAPGMFTLSSPVDTASGVETTPTLMWMPAVHAANYRVQVDTDGTFAGTLVINVVVGATTYSYTVPASMLSPGTTYFWRVIAENIYGQSVAGPRSFTT